MSNVINVKLGEGSYSKFVPGLVQWDRGQYLQITGVDLSRDVEVHFSLNEISGDAKRVEAEVIDGLLTVKIPQFLLEETGKWMRTYNAFAWIYVTDGESAQTEYKLVLEVQTRPKPDDYITDPEEAKIWSQLRDEIMGDIEEAITAYLDKNPVQAISVDDALSEESTNPVQNKVVTAKFKDLETTVGNVDVLLGTI